MSKFGAKKVDDPEHGKFDSRAEHSRFKTLLLLERCGDISDLQRQCSYILAESVVLGGRKKPSLKYTADFRYFKNGESIVEDVKGVVTKAFRVSQHLMKSVHGIDVIVVGVKHDRKKARDSAKITPDGR